MNPAEKELWKSLDYAVFGSNDPKSLQQGMDKVREQYERERSSLGNYLRSLRETEELSVVKMAEEAGVTAALWGEWEMDFRTPTLRELQNVAQRLGWRTSKMELVAQLCTEAPRYRLKRLTSFQPEALAARGDLEADLLWRSIDSKTRQRVQSWGIERGYAFPDDLERLLREVGQDEQAREVWLDEILGG